MKTSLAPGSKVVTEYLRPRRPRPTTWRRSASTSSATAARPASATPARCRRRSPTSSTPRTSRSSRCCRGNRNFEGRINPDVKMNYLASPPLCVAYALAGTMDIDLLDEPLGQDEDGEDVYLKDIWPSARGGRARRSRRPCRATCSASPTTRCSTATSAGTRSTCPRATASRGTSDSTYVRQPPYFEDFPPEPRGGRRTSRARACSPCSATPSPPTTSRPRARSRRTRRPAQYLNEHGVEQQGLQLLRRAPRQPRGDGARHVRQHPPAQPARARHRGRRHAASSRTARR